MPEIVNIHAAKTHLSRLVDRAAEGEEIVIARNGQPAARLVPLAPKLSKRRGYGAMRGQIWIAPDCFDPDPELERSFYEWSETDPLKEWAERQGQERAPR